MTSIRWILIAIAALAAAAPAGASAAVAHPDLSYDLDSPVADPNLNALDLYTPDGAAPGDARPVVVYVHGGAWRVGDKANQIADKVDLFTGAGYVFASVNYRLSPADVFALAPDRVKFPDHPHDAGEAIGWLADHVGEYGGDPTRLLLIGHSAGAHVVSLLSTDPSYVEAYGVEPWQLIGTVSLDTDAFDVADRIATGGPQARALLYNAFATPEENAVSGAWAAGSPVRFADARDPRFLLVTQAGVADRVADNRALATALGQDPDGVFAAPYDHEGINDAVGDAADSAGETAAIMDFFARMVGDSRAPRKPRLSRHPPKRFEIARARAKVRFRFASAGAGGYECRLDAKPYKGCDSPRSYLVGRGKHRFTVRALAASGRPGPSARFRFRVLHR